MADQIDPIGLDAWTYIEDVEAIAVLKAAKLGASAIGYWLTAKLLGHYLDGAGGLRLNDDDMKLVLRDRYFHDAMKEEAASLVRDNGPGKIQLGSQWKEHDFDEELSKHLWSAFHQIRYDIFLDGEVCGVAHGASLRFDGDVTVMVDENWDFSNPANDHRRPFFNLPFPPGLGRYREFEEGRFRRLEQRGWVKPFLAEGTFKSKGWALVGLGDGSQNLLSLDGLAGINLDGL